MARFVPVSQTGATKSQVMAGRISSAHRLVMFDACRFIAALGVIWFHAVDSDILSPSTALGRLSVAFYTMMAIVFLMDGLRRRPERTIWSYTASRFRRLYLPFLGWSALTAVGRDFLLNFNPHIKPPSLEPNTLITGTAEPLWFIPFVLLGGVLFFPLAKWCVGNRRREWMAAAGCLVIAVTLDWIPWNDPPLQGVPFVGRLLELSWHRWSALYWGMVLAVVFARWLKGSRWAAPAAWMGAGLVIAVTAYQWYSHVVPGLKVVGGVGVTLIAFAPARGAVVAWLARLAPLSFGIYLCHAIWIDVARTCVYAWGVPPCWQSDAVVFLTTVAASILSIKVLMRHPTLEWLAGKDPAEARRAAPVAQSA